VVDVSSSMPQLVAFSTCEAEYCTASLTVMAATYVKMVFNELHGIDPDYQLTVSRINHWARSIRQTDVPFVFVVESHDTSHRDPSRGRTQSLVVAPLWQE
jgi:uncharacterized protein YbbC (DUF1343 family)